MIVFVGPNLVARFYSYLTFPSVFRNRAVSTKSFIETDSQRLFDLKDGSSFPESNLFCLKFDAIYHLVVLDLISHYSYGQPVKVPEYALEASWFSASKVNASFKLFIFDLMNCFLFTTAILAKSFCRSYKLQFYVLSLWFYSLTTLLLIFSISVSVFNVSFKVSLLPN